jgi:hypothetical protein
VVLLSEALIRHVSQTPKAKYRKPECYYPEGDGSSLPGSYPQTRGLDCRVGGDDGTLDATAALEGRGRERDGTRLMMDWGLTMMISDAPS